MQRLIKRRSFTIADVLRVVHIVLVILLSFQVKKTAFVTMGLSMKGKELIDTKESYIISSLWQTKDGKFPVYPRSAKHNVVCRRLLLCGDIERWPGPISPNDETRNITEMSSLGGKRGIKIFHQNVRGLFPNISLVSVLLESFRGIDVTQQNAYRRL